MIDPDVALRINSLGKSFPPDIEALKSVDLEIKKGDFFGLLGPNGAEKRHLLVSFVDLSIKPADKSKFTELIWMKILIY